MRILAGSFLIVTAGALLSGSSQEFHNRYGAPDRERFVVQPGISLTVEYGSDNLACGALVDPPQPLAFSEEHVPPMSSENVSDILEQVAPTAMRGKQISTSLTVSGCNQVRLTDYENVSIMRSTHTCDPTSRDQDMRTVIRFKRNICAKQN